MIGVHPPAPKRILLLSIRPQYAEAILAGRKTVELRRRRPQLEEGERVLIYSSGGTRALVGAFVTKGVVQANPKELWRAFGQAAGISREAFTTYFAGKETGVAISVEGAWRAPEAVDLDDLRLLWPGFMPPQSYRYMDAASIRKLPRTWKGLGGVSDARSRPSP